MTDNKKGVIWIIAILLTICLIGGSVYLVKVWNYQKTVKSLTYSDIVTEDMEDGTYIGECNVDFINAKVAVTVEAGVITKIDILEHKNERGASAEIIIDDIVQQQSIDVDAVSGATNSSKVIKKAVENALSEAESRCTAGWRGEKCLISLLHDRKSGDFEPEYTGYDKFERKRLCNRLGKVYIKTVDVWEKIGYNSFNR